MLSRFSLLAACLGAAVFLAPLIGAGNASAFPNAFPSAFQCEQKVNGVLQEQGLSQDDVESVKVVRRSRGAKPASNYALDAWVRLNSCTGGALVVHMTHYCKVQDVYTTDNCRVGDLPNY